MNSDEQQKRRLQRSEVESLYFEKGVAPSRIAMRVGIEKKIVKKIIRKQKERARP